MKNIIKFPNPFPSHHSRKYLDLPPHFAILQYWFHLYREFLRLFHLGPHQTEANIVIFLKDCQVQDA